ncbi:hypothetical protein FOQG_17831 [Fusarium oxysporum f. sp. raphani 54005]|uniref:Uncharacterized protein n=2 Tax=Fusarium oxysporum TaxID=5507 RepID=X0B5Q5_FUSOX|nr:hypothetical protein FOVG_17112 [Fusarium oxysporum f. sp. pisi HDV247]EXK77460.1 hypothetical protein FOQG_17831 [Fusarium oxysporum f. sp. raphani 54005]
MAQQHSCNPKWFIGRWTLRARSCWTSGRHYSDKAPVETIRKALFLSL